ncbi:MAG TPA: hypothetical protein VFW16_01220, partial [Streptosporangiaceae bacterium]|nr:hypothetical protein [Streptosporangiaceae bacterium]
MAVHGTRRRDSVSWDHAGLLKLLAGLARDRTGLPVLRCYWYEAADGGRTAEHDALAEMPGLKLRLVNTRPGRREGIESQLRRDVVTLAKSGAIADAFIASADEHLAEIVAEVQDLGLRVVVLHIASDGGWTIPQPLRQECDDIVEISGVHLRPFVELIRGAEPAPAEEQYAAAGYGSGPATGDDAMMSAAMSRAGVPAHALPAPVGAYQAAAEYGMAQPYSNGGQVEVSSQGHVAAGAASGPAASAQAVMADSGRGSGQVVDLQRNGSGGQFNGPGQATGSRPDGRQPGDQAGYERAENYAQPAGTGLGGAEGSVAAQGQLGTGAGSFGTGSAGAGPVGTGTAGNSTAGNGTLGNGNAGAGTGEGVAGIGSAGQAGATGTYGAHVAGVGQHGTNETGQQAYGGTGQHAAQAGTGQHSGTGGAAQFPAREPGAFQYGDGAAQASASAQFTGAAHGLGMPQYAGQPQHTAADRNAPQHALPVQGMQATQGTGAPQHTAYESGAQHPAQAFGGSIPGNVAGGPVRDGAAGLPGGQSQGSQSQASQSQAGQNAPSTPQQAGAAALAGTGTGYPESTATGMHARSGHQNGGVQGPGRPDPRREAGPESPRREAGPEGPRREAGLQAPRREAGPQNQAAQGQVGLPQNGAGQGLTGHGGAGQEGARSGGYQVPQGTSGPAQTSSVHHLSGLSFPPGSAASAQNGYPGHGYQNGSGPNGYQNGSAQMGPAQIGPAQTGPAQTGPAPYPSFNGFQAGGIQNGSQASGNGTHGGLNPAGFEAAPLPAPPSPYGPINTGYFGGQSGPGEPGPGHGSGQHSMPAHTPPTGPSFQPRPPLHAQAQAQPQQAQVPQAQLYSSQQPPPQQAQPSALPAVRPPQPLAVSLPDAVKAAHHEGYT